MRGRTDACGARGHVVTRTSADAHCAPWDDADQVASATPMTVYPPAEEGGRRVRIGDHSVKRGLFKSWTNALSCRGPG
jgi:hypothetical protein